jgi:hypothetical protein
MKTRAARLRTRVVRFLVDWIDTTGTALIGIVVAGIGIVLTTQQPARTSAGSPEPSLMSPLLGWVLIGLGFGLVLLHMLRAYRINTYDPEVAWHIVDDWNSEDLIKSRSEAAKICLTYLFTEETNRTWAEIKKTNLLDTSSLSDVLDVLDDVGFFLVHGKLSDEVAHHYFAYYIFLYWLSGAREFVAEKRSLERPVWMNVEHCFLRLLLFESELSDTSQEDIKNHIKIKRMEYLTEERDLMEPA